MNETCDTSTNKSDRVRNVIRDLSICQKRLMNVSKETNECVIRDLSICQKRRMNVSKETNECVIRDLSICQKRPSNVSKETNDVIHQQTNRIESCVWSHISSSQKNCALKYSFSLTHTRTHAHTHTRTPRNVDALSCIHTITQVQYTHP